MASLVVEFPADTYDAREALQERAEALVQAIAGAPLEPRIPVSAGLAAAEPSRCRQKGCPFPAMIGGAGECAYHVAQRLFPHYWESCQMSHLLLRHAIYSLPDRVIDDGRKKDQRRQAAARTQFLLEGSN